MISPAAPVEPQPTASLPRTNTSARAAYDAHAAGVTAGLTDAAVHAAAEAIDRAAKALNNSVRLSVDAESGRTIVRVVDAETGQLIRQIPSEELLSLRHALERIAGLLIDRTA